MLGLQTGLQRIVGSHALRGVCALQAAQRDAVVGLQNGACGQFDVFQQRQVGGAKTSVGISISYSVSSLASIESRIPSLLP